MAAPYGCKSDGTVYAPVWTSNTQQQPAGLMFRTFTVCWWATTSHDLPSGVATAADFGAVLRILLFSAFQPARCREIEASSYT